MPAKTTKLTQSIKAAGGLRPKGRKPLWDGPEVDGPMGGITQSMLGKYVCCPERFRVRYVEGWKTPDRFDHKLGYGHMWHTMEESFAEHGNYQTAEGQLLLYCKKQCLKYPLQREEINHWYQTCKTQFPIYVEYWSKEKDVVGRQPLMQEQVVCVPYKLPNGVTVYLRGKLDGADLLLGKNGGVYLVEHKTKGDVDFLMIRRQLGFDLQVMTYFVALHAMQEQGGLTDVAISGGKKTETKLPIKGVRYNVIRRPFSGGKGSIRKRQATEGAKCPKCKNGEVKLIGRCDKCEGRGRIGAKPEETDAEFYGRFGEVLCEGVYDERGRQKPDNDWFARWRAEIDQDTVTKFKREFLDPILMNICTEYSWWKTAMEKGLSPFDHKSRMMHDVFGPRFHLHWRLPFGTYNSLTEGSGTSNVDAYLETGSTVGLVRATTLFEELSE